MITFGCNDEGALGRDTSNEGSEMEPGKVVLEGHVVQITAGDSHTAALLSDGKVYAWGSFRVSMDLPDKFSISYCPHMGDCQYYVCCRTQVGLWASHQMGSRNSL